jgi:cellulose synthase/poly-beta-1,6-N-acetylglucosamine synthase-like glycosyltransferase
LPDENIAIKLNNKVKIIPTGNILPALKRDIGVTNAKGEILAFLDDDTYPDKNWLKHAALNFKDESIACVCGPAITPKDELFLNKVSGMIYESFFVTGPARFRYLPLKERFTDDFPSCNFFIRKNIFQQIGGFNTRFWPGEDTILCLEVTHRLKKKILYNPTILTYHHRRPLFKKHLQQIANYALHRGYFVKRFPKTSFRFSYFLPSTIILTILFSISVGLLSDIKFLSVVLVYLFIGILFSFRIDLKLFFYIFVGIILTHFAYGINFLRGLFSTKLKEE